MILYILCYILMGFFVNLGIQAIDDRMYPVEARSIGYIIIWPFFMAKAIAIILIWFAKNIGTIIGHSFYRLVKGNYPNA